MLALLALLANVIIGIIGSIGSIGSIGNRHATFFSFEKSFKLTQTAPLSLLYSQTAGYGRLKLYKKVYKNTITYSQCVLVFLNVFLS